MANFVNVIISGNSKPLKAALDKATLSMTGFQKKVALGFVAAGAASMAFAVSAVKAAAKDQVAMAELERQIKASTGATEEQVHAQEQFLKSAGRAAAFSKSALIPGYESLIVATHDAAKAQDIMTVALDVARARHLDVTTVAEALAKGYAGNTRALRQLSPEMKKLISDGATFDQVLTRLNQNFGGAASDYAKTFQGRLDVLGNSINALKKQIGMALLPVAEKIVPVFQAIVDTMAQHKTLTKIVAIGIGALAGAFALATTGVIAYSVAAKAAAIANAFFASSELAVAAANPFTAAWAAVAAAGLSILVNKAYNAVKANYDLASSMGDLKTATDNLIGSQKELNAYMGPVASRDFATLKSHTDAYNQSLIGQKTAADKAAAALKAARQKAIDLAKVNKERLADALKTARQRLDELVQSAQNLADSIAGQVFGFVSLSDAVSTATATENDYLDALKERKDAYAELAKLQSTVYDVATGQTYAASAEDLAAAMERVAKAETAVTEAQGKRVDYVSQFRSQIEAAKQFAQNLQMLVGAGLDQTGLQQLLNLGPVAGAQVSKALIEGTAGITVGELNLTPLQAAATGLGGLVGQQAFGAQIGAAQTQATQVQQAQEINITVTSADPDKVVEALVKWSKRNGKLPAAIKVS